MSGEKGSVQVKIKQKESGGTYVWFVGHRLELPVLDVIKNDNCLTEFELMINTIFLMYYQSSICSSLEPIETKKKCCQFFSYWS